MMFSSCSGGLLGAVLYKLAQVQASLCCYVGISQSLYGGWMELFQRNWEWVATSCFFGPSYPVSTLALHAWCVSIRHQQLTAALVHKTK